MSSTAKIWLSYALPSMLVQALDAAVVDALNNAPCVIWLLEFSMQATIGTLTIAEVRRKPNKK